MNYKNKKITIFGLGSYKDGSGISAALFFLKKDAKLTITDLKTKEDLRLQTKRLKKYKNIEYVFGGHRKQDFQKADFIFKNPSAPQNSPYLELARSKKIPIINDWTIYFEGKPHNLLVGVTGTKGKSTTASLIYEILRSAGKDAVLCGNIGQSPIAVLRKIKPETIVVAELSSWLLQGFKDIKKSPQVAVITNFMADHLDKYKNIKEYFKDKENIFRFQNKNDFLILNKNDKSLKKLSRKAKSRVVWFDGTPQNAAMVVARILKIPAVAAGKAVKNFKGISGRLQFIKKINGIKYHNDTCATTPDATIYALKSLKKDKGRIILIAGGVDKKLDYKKLVKEIQKYCKALILFEGTASDRMIKELEIENSLKIENWRLKIKRNISSMKTAVIISRGLAQKGDIILLSPAAASFNMFKNEFDRGEQFNKAIK